MCQRQPLVSQWLKNKIQDEGVQARNIIKYNVPVNNSDNHERNHRECDSGASTPVYSPSSCRSNWVGKAQHYFPATSHKSVDSQSCSGDVSLPSSCAMRSNIMTATTTTSSTTSSCTSAVAPKSKHEEKSQQNHRSGRMIGTRHPRMIESEYRARYWGQMLDTLRRTIDEIYSACETDESEMECKEVIMILEYSKRDFFSLIAKMNLLRDYEQRESHGNRRSAIAWDERTTLPGKPIMHQVLVSAALATAQRKGSFVSIPLKVTTETGDDNPSTATVNTKLDNDSEVEGSWHLVVPKSRKQTRTPHTAVTPTNNNVIVSKSIFHTSPQSGSEMTNSSISSFKEDTGDEEEDEDDPVLALSIEAVYTDVGREDVGEDENGEEMEEEEDAGALGDEVLISSNSAPIFHRHDSVHELDAPNSFINEIDGEDDLRKLDEAIACVTSAERELTSQLDQAQYAEAALRHQLYTENAKESHSDEAWRFVKNTSIVSLASDVLNSSRTSSGGHWFPEDACEDSSHRGHHPTKASNSTTDLVHVSTNPLNKSDRCCECQCHNPGCSHLSNKSMQDRTTQATMETTEFSPYLMEQYCDSVNALSNMTNDGLSNQIIFPSLFHSTILSNQVAHDRVEFGNSNNDSQLVPANQTTAGSTPTKGLLFLADTGAKSRVPGHGIQMHERLSARSQKRAKNSMQELEQKQARARILRQQHLLDRSERVHELTKKVEEVHMQKRLLLHQRRSCLERRLCAAESKRKAELERRILKAHDEETKGREIAFIQSLEAEQKQYSILTKHEESRVRLHELAALRQRRLEEKLGREEAAKDRRRALEASRQARLDELQARWQSRAEQLASRAERLEHTRRAAARDKERHRKVKIASLEEQQRSHIEQLRMKIQRKQEDSERRHQETLREISRKAFEMSVLTHTGDECFTAAAMDPYPIQKWCQACHVLIVSEVSLKSHLHGKRHQRAVLEANDNRPLERSDLEAFNLLHLVDAPPEHLNPNSLMEQEKIRVRRKRARRLRQRMNQRAQQFIQEWESSKQALLESPHRTQLQKLVKDARRYLNLPDSGPWVMTRVQAMEKSLNAILRYLRSDDNGSREKLLVAHKLPSTRQYGNETNQLDKMVCVNAGLLPILVGLLGLIRSERPTATQRVPDRTYQIACELLLAVCQSQNDACRWLLCSNDLSVLLDCLISRLSSPLPGPRSGANEPSDTDLMISQCTLTLLECVTCVVTQLVESHFPTNSAPPYSTDVQRIQDLLAYVVSSGLVDLLSTRLSNHRQAVFLLRSGTATTTTSAKKHRASGFTYSNEYAKRLVLSTIALLSGLVRLLGKLGCPASALSLKPSDHHHTSQQSEDGRDLPIEVGSRCGSGLANSTGEQRMSCVSSRDNPPSSSRSSCQTLTEDSSLLFDSGNQTQSDDPTKLLETVNSTEVFGLLPLLYALLLDPSNRPTSDNSPQQQHDRNFRRKKSTPSIPVNGDIDPPPPFPNEAVGQITLQSLRLINFFAMISRPSLQSLLSGELTCLLTRHILLTLLSRCSINKTSDYPTTQYTEPEHKPTSKRLSAGDGDADEEEVDLTFLVPTGARKVEATNPPRGSCVSESLENSRPPTSHSLPDWVDDSPSGDAVPMVNSTTAAKICTPPNKVRSELFTKSLSLTEAILHEAILCVGHLCVLNLDNQSGLQTGPPPIILQRLISLPFDYFSQQPLTDVLYPTLIACCYLHANNLAILETELSPILLANYVEERLLERAMDALSDTDEKVSSSDLLIDSRFRLENRFPTHMWKAAKDYFSS